MANIITRIIDSKLNRKVSGFVGRFMKRLAWVVSAVAFAITVGAFFNWAFDGDPFKTKIIMNCAGLVGTLSLTLGWVGSSLAKSDDPEYQEAERALREFRKQYGWRFPWNA